MPIYECKICNYKTKIKSQLPRHLKTQKHANNMLKSEQIWSDDISINKKEPKKNSNYTFCSEKEPKKNPKRTEKEPGFEENGENCDNSKIFLMEAKNQFQRLIKILI